MTKGEILVAIGVFILMGTLGGVETGRMDFVSAIITTIIGFSFIGIAAGEELL